MISLDQYNALQDSAGFFRRNDRGRIMLQGSDRVTYLQGLLTNDIAALRPGSGCYAALLTPQGRMISDMRVFHVPGDKVLLDLDRSLAEPVCQHLEKFVITEDVVVTDVSAGTAQVGVYGPRASAAIGSVIDARLSDDPNVVAGAVVAQIDAMRPFESVMGRVAGATPYLLRSDDIGVNGFDVVLPDALAADLESALTGASAMPVNASATEVTRIEAGLPKFLVDMDTSTIPLEAGIEARAISMTKGCYVGQEVIVRVLHRGGGRVARRLVQLTATSPISRPDRIFSEDRDVGSITSAVESPRRGPIALGYVQRDFAQPGTALTVRSSSGPVECTVARVP